MKDKNIDQLIEERKVQYYGGSLGPWIPMIVMVVGIAIFTMTGNGGMPRMILMAFISMAIGFLLCKQKKDYSAIALHSMRNPLMCTVLLAFILAGMMSQLLRQSGLIQALIWVTSKFNLNTAFLPLVGFLVSLLIATSCGTSTGTVAAVSPVLLPLAYELGTDVGLMCGAIISGAIFGDNLAPISDTTIGSAMTQEASLSDVVRTRAPFSLVAAALAAVGFIVCGLRMQSATGSFTADPSVAKALVLLLLPVIMVVMMRKGWSLVSTLLICNILGIVLDLVLGCIPFSQMVDPSGPIISGMTGMLNLVLYVIFVFQIMEILINGGALERLEEKLVKVCKSVRTVELINYLVAIIGSAACMGSTGCIMSFGPMIRNISKEFNLAGTRSANILDATACAATGLFPFCNPVIVSLGVAATIEGLDPNFSFVNIMPYTFHCWALLLVFLVSILTGIGRKFETPNAEAAAEA